MPKTVGKIIELRGPASQWAEFDVVHKHFLGDEAHGHVDYSLHDSIDLSGEIVYKDRYNSTGIGQKPMSSNELLGLDKPLDITALDPNDPIEAVLISIVKTNRKKRADYAQDGNIFSNFEQAAFAAGVEVNQGIEYMIATKQARLVALRSNGREPANESVADTMLDRAVYSIIALAWSNQAAEVNKT